MDTSQHKNRIKSNIIAKIFGQVLREARKERGYSQESLGFKSGYHRTYISLIERGNKIPTLQTLFNLASALDITASDLVERVQNVIKRNISSSSGNTEDNK